MHSSKVITLYIKQLNIIVPNYKHFIDKHVYLQIPILT